jgi:hypothetical protein
MCPSYEQISCLTILTIIILVVSSSSFIGMGLQMKAFAKKPAQENEQQLVDILNNKSKITGHTPAALLEPLMNSTSNNSIVNDTGQNAAIATEPQVSSMMNPANLMTSAINQIRDSAANITNTDMKNNNSLGDSATILLSHQIIPAKDFILIYSSAPKKITNGHLAAKLPCDTSSSSKVVIFAGKIPNLKPVPVEVIKGMSKPGYMCMYDADILQRKLQIESRGNNNNNNNNTTIDTITDIALVNPTNEREVLLNTSTILVSIN